MLKKIVLLSSLVFATPCIAAIEHIVPADESDQQTISIVSGDELDREIRERAKTAMEMQKEALMRQQPTGGGFTGMDEEEVEEEDKARAAAAEKEGIPGLRADTNIELMKIAQELNVRKGNLFDVVVPVEPGRQWNYDSSEDKVAKLLDSTQSAEHIVYNFEAIEDGFDRLYFDYIEMVDGKASVVESRILDLMVGVPSAQAKQD